MSVNCIRCVKNRRTGHDLLCDECRKISGAQPPECPEHPGVRMTYADGTMHYHDLKYPHWRCEFWIGSGVCGATRGLTPAAAVRDQDQGQ